MELVIEYLICIVIRCLVLGPILWISGKITNAEIGIKEALITILAAELSALPFYGIRFLSELSVFYILGYFASLSVFVFLIMKATKADFFSRSSSNVRRIYNYQNVNHCLIEKI